MERAIMIIVTFVACLYVYQVGHRPPTKPIKTAQEKRGVFYKMGKEIFELVNYKTGKKSYYLKAKNLIESVQDTYDWQQIKNKPPISNYLNKLLNHIAFLMWGKNIWLFAILTLIFGFSMLGAKEIIEKQSHDIQLPLLMLIPFVFTSMHWCNWLNVDSISQKFNWLICVTTLLLIGLWIVFRKEKQQKTITQLTIINPFIIAGTFNSMLYISIDEVSMPATGGFFFYCMAIIGTMTMTAIFIIAIDDIRKKEFEIPILGQEIIEPIICPACMVKSYEPIIKMCRCGFTLNNEENKD